MLDNWNFGLMVSITFMFLMLAASADNVETAKDSKENPVSSENSPVVDNDQHTIAKRAWNQLQSGWGKRSLDEDSVEDLRRLMQQYSEQLMANKVGSDEYTPEDLDMSNDKRAWKQMSNAWGKRDWSQLRGNGWGKRDTAGNWNNMRGLWGKRNPGWNKLSSAWGK